MHRNCVSEPLCRNGHAVDGGKRPASGATGSNDRALKNGHRPRPDAFTILTEFPIQWTVVLITIPVWNSWLVCAMTYHLHHDLLANFTNEGTHCPVESVAIPAASWSIGVFEPQRYIWLAGVVLHFPARIFCGAMYSQLFLSATNAPHYNTQWYQFFARNVYISNCIETVGLVLASIFDIGNYFTLHIVATVAWIFGACGFALDSTVAHYASGWYHTSTKAKVTFWLKVCVAVLMWSSMLITATFYPLYRHHCHGAVYLLFTIAEYTIGLCEGAFNVLVAVDFYGVRVGLFARYDALAHSNGLALARRCGGDTGRCCVCLRDGEPRRTTAVEGIFANEHYKPQGGFCAEFGRFV